MCRGSNLFSLSLQFSFELPVTFFWTLGNFGNTFLISFPVRGYSHWVGWFVEKSDKIIPLGNSFHRRSQLIANPHKKILKPQFTSTLPAYDHHSHLRSLAMIDR